MDTDNFDFNLFKERSNQMFDIMMEMVEDNHVDEAYSALSTNIATLVYYCTKGDIVEIQQILDKLKSSILDKLITFEQEEAVKYLKSDKFLNETKKEDD